MKERQLWARRGESLFSRLGQSNDRWQGDSRNPPGRPLYRSERCSVYRQRRLQYHTHGQTRPFPHALHLGRAWPILEPTTVQPVEPPFYKGRLIPPDWNSQFEQTEMRFRTRCVAASNTKKLEHIYGEIKRLETEFRCGRYYPDLLDEQIVIIREELRLILADPAETRSMSEPADL
jgi:hypothetical protein